MEICGKEAKESWAKLLKSLKHSAFFSRTWLIILNQGGNLNRCDGPFLLNEHSDLHSLLHKNIVNIILLNLEKNFKNCRKEKKI